MMSTTQKTARLARYALLIALLAVLGFTPLGFITVPPVSITIMHIPVIIGAVLFGPGCGALLGGTFGVISLIKAIMMPLPPIDMLFSPFSSGAPFASIVMCIAPRILLGVIAGGIAMAFRKRESLRIFSIGFSAAVATISHTLLVLGCLWMFFKALPLREVFLAIIGVNGLLELGAAVAVSIAVCEPLSRFVFSRRLEAAHGRN